MTKAIDKRELIAALNDQFRCNLIPGIPGMKVSTHGIAELDENSRYEIWMSVMSFEDFTEDNDPYGEHDFGAIDHAKAGKVFWKIDCFADERCELGSEYPDNPSRSYRVLTIMLADEY